MSPLYGDLNIQPFFLNDKRDSSNKSAVYFSKSIVEHDGLKSSSLIVQLPWSKTRLVILNFPLECENISACLNFN